MNLSQPLSKAEAEGHAMIPVRRCAERYGRGYLFVAYLHAEQLTEERR
jgi:hypothetical protein